MSIHSLSVACSIDSAAMTTPTRVQWPALRLIDACRPIGQLSAKKDIARAAVAPPRALGRRDELARTMGDGYASDRTPTLLQICCSIHQWAGGPFD